MRFTMGGRKFDLTAEDVRRRMTEVQPEPFQKYVVELNGTVYPPKQVINTCLDFPRTSFTTMEAQRVLTRLGFVCRQAGTGVGKMKAWVATTGDEGAPDASSGLETEMGSFRAALTTIQLAVARLDDRVMALEKGRSGR
jgi:hypothetical protein